MFITYDTGVSKADADCIVRAVTNLKKNAIHNKFEVSLDSFGPAPSYDVVRAIINNFRKVRICKIYLNIASVFANISLRTICFLL